MRALIIVAKAPLVGQVKTRLGLTPAIGPARAAELADAFLRDTLQTCRALPSTRRFVSFAPRASAAYFRALDAEAELLPQPDGGLGERLVDAFAAVFAAGVTRAVMIGADTPHLDPSVLAAAFEALERAPAVVGPSSDGGYYLIGLAAHTPGLFAGIEWSTPSVFSDTQRRAGELGLGLELLEETFDVDEPADLERLAELLRLDPTRCPHTRRLIAAGRSTG
jgi:uncharacterized protein